MQLNLDQSINSDDSPPALDIEDNDDGNFGNQNDQ